MAMTIPAITKDNWKIMNDNLDLLNETLSDSQKKQIEFYKDEDKAREDERATNRILRQAAMPKFFKAKEMITKGWEKLMKGRWFDKAMGFFKGMVQNASGWLENLIAFVFLLRSGILQQLIPMVLDTFAQLITTLIKWAPVILKFVWDILTKTLPRLLKGIFNMVFDTLGLPKDHPIRKFFNYIFDNFGPFMNWLLDSFVQLITKVAEFGGIIWDYISPAIKSVIDNAPGFADAVSNFFASVWDTLAPYLYEIFESYIKEPIMNIIAIGETLFSVFKSIMNSGIVQSIIEVISPIFKKLSPIAKAFAKFSLIMAIFPIVSVKWMIQLTKFILVDLPKMWKPFVKGIKKFFTKTIPALFKKAIDSVMSPIRSVFGKFVTMFEPIGRFLNSMTQINADTIIGNIKTKLSAMWDAVTGAATNIVPGFIKEGAKKLGDGVKAFIKDPATFLNDMFNSLISGFRALPDKIIDGISGVFNWILAVLSIAGDLISGSSRERASLTKTILSGDLGKEISKRKKVYEGDVEAPVSNAPASKETYEDYKRGREYAHRSYVSEKQWIAGERKRGGKVKSGEPYLVGEIGQEIVVPDSNGTVVTNNDFGKMISLLESINNKLTPQGQNAPSFVPMTRAR